MAESAEGPPAPQSDSPGDVTLTAWALATFDVTVLVLVVLALLHASGALADLLSGLNTVVGIAIFGYLWVLVVLAVRWVLSDAALGQAGLGRLALRGLAGGAVAGIVFLLGVVVIAVAPQVVVGSLEPLSVVLIALIGSGFAAVVGSLIGLLATLLNVAVYRAAGVFVPRPSDREATTAATHDRQ